MSWIKDVRKAFGISQDFVATLLQTKRSNINQLEMNRRRFSSDTKSRLYLLEEVMRKASELPVSDIQTQEEDKQRPKLNAALSRRAKTCRVQAEGLKLKLEDLQEKYKVCTLRLKAVDFYRKENPKQDPDSIANRADRMIEIWYSIFETETTLDLEKCGTAAQTLLQLQISTLEFEAGKAAEMMA